MPKKYTWDAALRVYRDENGNIVPESRIKDDIATAALAFSAAVQERCAAIVDDYDEQVFSEWCAGLRDELSDWHNAMAVLALGGEKQAAEISSLNAQVWQATALALAAQLLYFSRFTNGVVGGAIDLDGRIAPRAASYPLAGYSTYENAVRLREVNIAAYDEESRICAQDGGTCDDCATEAGRGWVPTGTLRAVGDSICGSRCRCYFIFRQRPADEEE